jgi:hypothetical protein
MLAESESNILQEYVDKGIIGEDLKAAAARLAVLRNCAEDDVVIHRAYAIQCSITG